MQRTEAEQPARNQLIGVSLFTGAGGLDIGMERAGFSPRFVSDFDEWCIASLKANQDLERKVRRGSDTRFLENAEINHADICDLSGKTIRNRIRRRIDCVYGGPPCQTFSSCGQMGSISDPRGLLIFEFCRFIEEARPRTFLLENVRGLVTARCNGGKPGGVLLQLIKRFESAGYGVAVHLLNSADFGSYQRRVRCFVVGVDSGTPPASPTPTHERTSSSESLFGSRSRSWRTLGEFLNEHSDLDESNWTRPSLTLAQQLDGIPNGSGLKSSGIVESTRPGGHWGYRQGTFIADPELPARTVTGSSSQDWIRLKDGSLRRITLAEAAKLQGFPEGWIFKGPKSSRYKQVGNAVPVILGEVMGRAIRGVLSSYKPNKPVESAPLPARVQAAMEYTKREESRNGLSRRSRVSASSC